MADTLKLNEARGAKEFMALLGKVTREVEGDPASMGGDCSGMAPECQLCVVDWPGKEWRLGCFEWKWVPFEAREERNLFFRRVNPEIWAVANHDSEFSVVPKPGDMGDTRRRQGAGGKAAPTQVGCP